MKITWVWKKFYDLTPAELYAILQHRGKIFAVEQNEAYLDADGKDIHAMHLMGWLEKGENNFVAYSRIFLPNEINEPIKFGRVSVSKEYRNLGIAADLVQQIFLFIENSKFKSHEFLISAQQHLLAYYEDFCFQGFGDIHYEGRIPHKMMRRESLQNQPSKLKN